MPKILDGKAIASEIEVEIAEETSRARQGYYGQENMFAPPCLAVVLCSEDPASEIYVEKKQAACKRVGINSYLIKPFEGGIDNWNKPQDHLLATIKYLNENDSIHGVLVQLPLPNEIFTNQIFDAIDPRKDVDVFHPENVGLLMQNRPRFIPCTPHGVQELLVRSGVGIEGKKVVIINRSDIVGKPLSALLVQDRGKANATVSMCHDYTPPEMLKSACLIADIIVVAVGKPDFLTADMVTKKSVVVDVGINRVANSRKIVGDVHPDVYSIAQAYSPVPGGCGPMTVAMLLKNTVLAFRDQRTLKESIV